MIDDATRARLHAMLDDVLDNADTRASAAVEGFLASVRGAIPAELMTLATFLQRAASPKPAGAMPRSAAQDVLSWAARLVGTAHIPPHPTIIDVHARPHADT